MKKKVLSALAMTAIAISASAQGYAGTTFNDRIGHGQDSIEVINQFSLYREAFKDQSYAEAYDAWKIVLEKAPLAQIRIYQDGDVICQQLLQKETDPAKKQEIFEKYSFAQKATDTGSAEAQVALFSYRISHLTEHLKKNRKDFVTERALTMLVGKRRSLLNYLKRQDIERYRAIVKALGLRK